MDQFWILFLDSNFFWNFVTQFVRGRFWDARRNAFFGRLKIYFRSWHWQLNEITRDKNTESTKKSLSFKYLFSINQKQIVWKNMFMEKAYLFKWNYLLLIINANNDITSVRMLTGHYKKKHVLPTSGKGTKTNFRLLTFLKLRLCYSFNLSYNSNKKSIIQFILFRLHFVIVLLEIFPFSNNRDKYGIRTRNEHTHFRSHRLNSKFVK